MTAKETAKHLTLNCKSVAEAEEYAFLKAFLDENETEFWLEVYNEIRSAKTIT